MPASQLTFFTDEAGPQGLHYEADFITADQEQMLLGHILSLNLTPFQFGKFEGKRRVASFGYQYNYSTQRLEPADALPAWILPIAAAIERADRLPEGSIGHVLFTEYEAGTGIGWHKDKKQFDKLFGLSLASACSFRFRKKSGTKWERYTLLAEPRSLYTMTDESRHVWEHSIPPVKSTRYSATFRTMAGAHAPR